MSLNLYSVNEKHFQLSNMEYEILLEKLAHAIHLELIRLQDMIDNKQDKPYWEEYSKRLEQTELDEIIVPVSYLSTIQISEVYFDMKNYSQVFKYIVRKGCSYGVNKRRNYEYYNEIRELSNEELVKEVGIEIKKLNQLIKFNIPTAVSPKVKSELVITGRGLARIAEDLNNIGEYEAVRERIINGFTIVVKDIIIPEMESWKFIGDQIPITKIYDLTFSDRTNCTVQLVKKMYTFKVAFILLFNADVAINKESDGEYITKSSVEKAITFLKNAVSNDFEQYITISHNEMAYYKADSCAKVSGILTF